jgi:predicted transcriptional regulator
MLTSRPNPAERNSEGIETTAERKNGGTEPTVNYATQKEQANRLQSKLRELLEGLKDRIATRFEQALERLKNSINRTRRNELNTNFQAKPKDNNSQAELEDDILKKYQQIATIEIPRRRALKLLCGLVTTAAVAPFLPEGLGNIPTALAARAETPPTKPNSETEAWVQELERIITEAKDFIASKVPMLEAYPDTLQRMDRTNAVIGLQIPSDIGNPPSPNPEKPNKNGFELGSRIYSPYLDSDDQEKGVIYQRIIDDLTKIKQLEKYQSASTEEQKEMLLRYLNSLAEQILERQKRYSAVMSKFPGQPTRVGIGAEVVDYVDFIADALGITDPEIKAAILRTHPHVAQIIAMQQAVFDVDIQMNGLPPGFVESDGGKSWSIFNPIKKDAIPALTEFVRILSLALPTEFRISTANEPLNIHMGNQATTYAQRLLEAQLRLIENNSKVTLIGPSIKTDYEGRLDTTFRIIDSFITEIERVIENKNITDPDIINKLLNCLPTLTVYGRDVYYFMNKANKLVDEIGIRIKRLLQTLTEKGLLKAEDLEKVKVKVNFSEMGIEWPHYQGDSGLEEGTEQMIKIVKNLKSAIERWQKSYPWLEFTGIFFIHNPGGPDYGSDFDNCARETTSGIPVGESSIPVIGKAPNTNPKTNDECFNKLCNAVK